MLGPWGQDEHGQREGQHLDSLSPFGIKVGERLAVVPGVTAQLEDKEGKSQMTDFMTFSEEQGRYIKERLLSGQ